MPNWRLLAIPGLMTKTLIHLICGATGAGKTTYAVRLSGELGAVRFSIDEWMTALFWMDASQPLNPHWAMERVRRCSAQIWRTAAEVAGRGVPCILEVGLTTAERRAHFLGLARDAGLPARLHFLDVSADERWRRVEGRHARNDEAGQLPCELTREMFDFVETMWEAPSDEELAAADGVKVSG